MRLGVLFIEMEYGNKALGELVHLIGTFTFWSQFGVKLHKFIEVGNWPGWGTVSENLACMCLVYTYAVDMVIRNAAWPSTDLALEAFDNVDNGSVFRDKNFERILRYN
jgi:hypothetical protein